MITSPSVKLIAAALVKVHAALKAITKDRANSHFGNRYATLDAIMDEIRPLLAAESLFIVQGGYDGCLVQLGSVFAVAVTTHLFHESGEFIGQSVTIPLAKVDPQGAMAAYTYARRAGVSAILGLSTEDDDDGNKASRPARKKNEPAAQMVQKANEVGAKKLGDLIFPKLKGLDTHEGKKFADIPNEVFAVALGIASAPAVANSKSAKAMAKAFEDYLEERRQASFDEPHSALKSKDGDLTFPGEE